MTRITCTRCGREGDQLTRPPLRNDLGERVFSSICQTCWSEWLRFQTALINHHGLDVREPQTREFLAANMEAYLFKQGTTDHIDTSKQGKIAW